MKDCTLSQGWINAQQHIIEFNKKAKKDRINIYNQNPKRCLKCNIPIPYDLKINKFCSSQCSGSFNTKGRKHSKETKQKISNSVFTSEKCRSSIRKKRSNFVYELWKCKVCPTLIIQKKSNRKFCSQKCCNEDRRNGYLFQNKPYGGGGIRMHGGRGKQGWYKGYWCQSTWELVWVVYNLDHGFSFERNTQPFKYIYDGKERNYYPDFIINGDTYIEIKGWIDAIDKIKFQQFPKKLIILREKDLRGYFQYVYDKYGKDLVSLYDKKEISL